jgi:hypothetical protein
MREEVKAMQTLATPTSRRGRLPTGVRPLANHHLGVQGHTIRVLHGLRQCRGLCPEAAAALADECAAYELACEAERRSQRFFELGLIRWTRDDAA